MADYTIILNEHDPQCVAALVNRGVCRAREANLSAAISDYDLAIKAEPLCGVAFFNRAVAYEKTGNPTQGENKNVYEYEKNILILQVTT